MFRYTYLILLLFVVSKTQAQKVSKLTFNETNVELSVEDEHWFTSVEGSTEGPEMIHRLGTLRDIIETIDDSTNMKISPKLERKLWKIIARGPEANNLTPYLEKILA